MVIAYTRMVQLVWFVALLVVSRPTAALERQVRGGWIYETWGVPDGLPTRSVLDVVQDGQGYLWIGTFDGLVRFDGHSFTTYDITTTPRLPNNRVVALMVNKVGEVWFTSGMNHVGVVKKGAVTTYSVESPHAKEMKRRILARIRTVVPPEGLSPNGKINASIRDRDGSWWFATMGGGLKRIAPARVETLFPDLEVHGVVIDTRGSLWVQSSNRGLCVAVKGEGACIPVAPPGQGEQFITISRTEEGEVYAATHTALYTMAGTLPRLVSRLPAGVRVTVVFVSQREIYVGTMNGLYTLRGGRFERVILPSKQGKEVVISLSTDRNGRLYVGTYGHGLFIREGERFTQLSDGKGLGGNFVQFVHEDAHGWRWVGTKKGLTILSPKRVAIIRQSEGLYDNSVFTFLPDGLGNVWMSSNKGISRVSEQQLRQFVRGERDHVEAVHYDESDGMLIRECNGVSMFAGARDGAGRLYFSCLRGVTRVTPEKLRPMGESPPVVIHEVQVDGRSAPWKEGVEMGPSERRITVRFGAVALLGAHKVRYMVKLEGYDDRFQVVRERSVTYTNLSPGVYTLRIRATNRDGVRSDVESRLAIRVRGHWSSLLWVRVTMVALVIVLLIALFGAALHRVRRRQRELAAVNEKLRALDLMKDRFLAATSHELRTPLHGIIAMTEAHLRSAGSVSPREAQRSLTVVRHSARRLLYLINDIIDFEAIRQGEGVSGTPHGLVPIAPLVEGVVEHLRIIHGAKQLEWVVEIPPGLSVRMEGMRFEQILFNLLGNACKYTRKGSVRLFASGLKEQVRVVIEDTGVGIPAEQLATIWEPFVRGAVHHDEPGSGLGLFVSRRLIEGAGGSVTLKSDPAQGTRVTLLLPGGVLPHEQRAGKADVPALSNVELWEEQAAADSGEYTVLSIDDDPLNQMVITRLLEKSPFEVITCYSGARGVELVQERKPDVVLLDLMMPEMDGFEVLRQIRARHSAGRLPVIVLTARQSEDLVVKGFEAGANDYVMKPFSRGTLLTRLSFQLSITQEYLATEESLRGRLEEQQAVCAELAEKYGERRLDEGDARELLERVEQLMGEEVWRDPMISMKRIARRLKVKQADLSQVLNTLRGQNFHQFINSYRIEEVCRQLSQGDANTTILDMAYGAGFSSKSAFQHQFKQQKGMTPSQYRRKNHGRPSV